MCLSSWVLSTAAIGLKTKENFSPKTTLQTPETVGNPKNWNLRGATVREKALREYGYKNSHAFSHGGPVEGFPVTRVRKERANKAAMLLC